MTDDFIRPRPGITQAELDAQKRKGWTGFHPEDYCHRCGGPNISWHVDSETWNRIMRPDGHEGRWSEIICPTCFVELAGFPHVELSLTDATKALVETATRLGHELGRKEALAEIADEMGVVQDDPRIGYVTIQLDHGSYRLLQAHQSPLGGLTATPATVEPPEDTEAGSGR